jgi:glutamate synthase (NADPH/NADH) small chain
MLRQQGYQVTIYDRYDRVGGLLIYGIPGFKLEKHVVERAAQAAGRWRCYLSAECRYRYETSFEDVRAHMTPF